MSQVKVHPDLTQFHLSDPSQGSFNASLHSSVFIAAEWWSGKSIIPTFGCHESQPIRIPERLQARSETLVMSSARHCIDV
jgi:hypothetical protein